MILKNHVTLKTGVTADWKFWFGMTRTNYILNNFYNSYFNSVVIK